MFGTQKPQQTVHQPFAGSPAAPGLPGRGSGQAPFISVGSQNRPPQNRRLRGRPITPASKAARAQPSTAESEEVPSSQPCFSTSRSRRAVPVASAPTFESPDPGVPYSPLPHG